jgi:hypothetical protein
VIPPDDWSTDSKRRSVTEELLPEESCAMSVTESNYRWRNVMADWRLKAAPVHLEKAAATESPQPVRLAIDAARMHLGEAQSYLRDD